MSDADRPRVPGEQFEEDVVAAWHAAYLKAEANDAMESDFDAFISLSWNGYPMLHAQLETSHARLEAARRERDEARDSAWYRFGCQAWTWLAGHWDGEDGWELGGLAVEAGLAERVAYDPAKHGECEADPGDEIIYPLKGDPKNINPRADAAVAKLAAVEAERDRAKQALDGLIASGIHAARHNKRWQARAEQAEAENVRLRAALERNATVRVLCGGCGRTYLRCRECGMSAHLHDVPASDELAHDPACLLTSREPSPPPAPCTGC